MKVFSPQVNFVDYPSTGNGQVGILFGNSVFSMKILVFSHTMMVLEGKIGEKSYEENERLKAQSYKPSSYPSRSSLLTAPTLDDERRGSRAANRTFAAQPQKFSRTPRSEEWWGREEK